MSFINCIKVGFVEVEMFLELVLKALTVILDNNYSSI